MQTSRLRCAHVPGVTEADHAPQSPAQVRLQGAGTPSTPPAPIPPRRLRLKLHPDSTTTLSAVWMQLIPVCTPVHQVPNAMAPALTLNGGQGGRGEERLIAREKQKKKSIFQRFLLQVLPLPPPNPCCFPNIVSIPPSYTLRHARTHARTHTHTHTQTHTHTHSLTHA